MEVKKEDKEERGSEQEEKTDYMRIMKTEGG